MTVDDGARTLALGRAAQELELRREEFRLALQLGLVRTVPAAGPGGPAGDGTAGPPGSLGTGSTRGSFGTGGTRGPFGARGARRRVDRREIDRLRAAPDFPHGLRERVRAVGTAEAAALLSVTPDRFTKLARTGHFSPVRFYLNRYRTVVWLYLAGELGEFALAHRELLTGRLPRPVRERFEAGEDHRPRNWRARRLGLLLRSTEDPWERAAAIASLLDPVQLAEVADDPYERAYLDRLRPEPPSGRTESAAALEITDRLLLADDPDEILWHRLSLVLALDEAREQRQAPRPDRGADRGARPLPALAPPGGPPASAGVLAPCLAFASGGAPASGRPPDGARAPRPLVAPEGEEGERPRRRGAPGPARHRGHEPARHLPRNRPGGRARRPGAEDPWVARSGG
ncbi:DUF6397 family protein [Streptomyces sp. NPDC053755]|uniref:DUF6397 family protein n=1 Tax=Streptomyces sp. NPDC053755 TaxID=3155815 RepID=UPI0034479B1B